MVVHSYIYIYILFEVTKFDSISLLLLLLLLPGLYNSPYVCLVFWGKFISANASLCLCVHDFILVWNSLSFLRCNVHLQFCFVFPVISYYFYSFLSIALWRSLLDIWGVCVCLFCMHLRNGMSENTQVLPKNERGKKTLAHSRNNCCCFSMLLLLYFRLRTFNTFFPFWNWPYASK